MGFHQYTYYGTYSLSFVDTPASPSWTLQVSHSWTLCCLEETLLRNFLGASDFKRTVVVLFSGRKGHDLESHSHLCHGRKGCLQKKTLSTESRTLSVNIPQLPTSLWLLSQNLARTGMVLPANIFFLH